MWKQLLLVAKRNLKTFWVDLWQVKFISLILSKAEHYVGSNRDITSSIFCAVTPLSLKLHLASRLSIILLTFVVKSYNI